MSHSSFELNFRGVYSLNQMFVRELPSIIIYFLKNCFLIYFLIEHTIFLFKWENQGSEILNNMTKEAVGWGLNSGLSASLGHLQLFPHFVTVNNTYWVIYLIVSRSMESGTLLREKTTYILGFISKQAKGVRSILCTMGPETYIHISGA